MKCFGWICFSFKSSLVFGTLYEVQFLLFFWTRAFMRLCGWSIAHGRDGSRSLWSVFHHGLWWDWCICRLLFICGRHCDECPAVGIQSSLQSFLNIQVKFESKTWLVLSFEWDECRLLANGCSLANCWLDRRYNVTVAMISSLLMNRAVQTV